MRGGGVPAHGDSYIPHHPSPSAPLKKLRYSGELYVRPDPLYVVIRDMTVVHYKGGEGVAPHVDGKDATLLLYLSNVDHEGKPPGSGGGRTVFPEVGVQSVPLQGDAMLYDSRDELLHFAEPVQVNKPRRLCQRCSQRLTAHSFDVPQTLIRFPLPSDIPCRL